MVSYLHGTLEPAVSKKKDKTAEADTPANLPDNRAMLLISRALADPRRVEVFRRIACAESTGCTSKHRPTPTARR